MSKELVVLHLKSKVVSLEVKDFGDSPIDTEELLQVHYHNLVGDSITFPVLFNRISLFKAQMEDLLRETQLDFDIFCAQTRQELRKSLVTDVDDGKGKGGTKRKFPTVDEVEDGIARSPSYKVKRVQLNKVKFELDILDGLYWAAKSKDQKLNTFSGKITPEEFENAIIEGTINSVLIKVHQNLGSKNT